MKDKIRYTENYLHSMRMGTSYYSPGRETYLENYLAELREIEKKEAAAQKAGNTTKAAGTAVSSGTQSAVKAPEAESRCPVTGAI